MKRLSAVVSDEEYRRVERLAKAGAANSIAQLVREAMAEHVERLSAGKLLNLRPVPLEKGRRKVENYPRTNTGVVWPDEMAEELGIDYRIVLSAVQDLLKEGKVEEAETRPGSEPLREGSSKQRSPRMLTLTSKRRES